MKELIEGLGLGFSNYYIISSLGVIRTIRTEWRYLSAVFYRFDLYDLITETTTTKLNSFLQH